MDRRKFAAGFGAVAAAALVAGTMFACAPQGEVATTGDMGESMPENPTYAQLIEMYPNEYNSAMMGKTDEEGEDNSHAGFQPLMETPAIRDVSGAIIEVVDEDDPQKSDVAMKCVACKTSHFVDFYERDGLTAYTDRLLDADGMKAINGEYWDCYSCHVVKDGEWTIQANAAWANADFAPNVSKFMQSLNPKEAVCGQCHNTVSPRAYITDEATQQSYDPYRYGPDLDSRYKAMVEDEIYVVDEPTGIKMVSMNHPQIEVFQGSIHQSMGLTCIDCHMTQATDEKGESYTSHNASGSVAENDAAMEKCLTCHKTQNDISTVDDMRAFLKQNQEAQAKRQNEVDAKLSALYDGILAAVNNGGVDADDLEAAKDKYSLANWYVKEQQGNLFDPVDGAQIAHNPEVLRQCLERADALVDEGMELLA